jgi:hypothetical protein
LQAGSFEGIVLFRESGYLLAQGLVFSVVFLSQKANVSLLALELLLLGLVCCLRSRLQGAELLFEPIPFLSQFSGLQGLEGPLFLLCGVLYEKSLIFFFEDLVLEDEGVGEPECVLFLEDHLERPGVVFFLEVADWRGSVKLRRARHFNNKIYNPLKRLNKARFTISTIIIQILSTI